MARTVIYDELVQHYGIGDFTYLPQWDERRSEIVALICTDEMRLRVHFTLPYTEIVLLCTHCGGDSLCAIMDSNDIICTYCHNSRPETSASDRINTDPHDEATIAALTQWLHWTPPLETVLHAYEFQTFFKQLEDDWAGICADDEYMAWHSIDEALHRLFQQRGGRAHQLFQEH